MNTYFFVLGSNLYLSLAELQSIFPEQDFEVFANKIAFLETDQDINLEKLLDRLGGTIKVGKIETYTTPDKLTPEVFDMIEKKEKENQDNKINFGFSVYGKKDFKLKSVAMKIKTDLKDQNISSRWVSSGETKLSSVTVEQNDLLQEGIEINLFFKDNQVLLGRTQAVQKFKDFSFRDYGRPKRDAHSGMLPPKLAKIMINLSKTSPDQVILDPFCGSGTILTEAVLMGYTKILGNDIYAKAIKDTKENIDWLSNNYKLAPFDLGLYNQDVRKLREKIKDEVLDAVITEPYLGPQRDLNNPTQVKQDLEKLYWESLQELHQLIKPGAYIVMVWPVLNFDKKYFLDIDLQDKFDWINPLEKYNFKLSFRNTIIYNRDKQKVFREIVILRKRS